jgi:hypothetical protein
MKRTRVLLFLFCGFLCFAFAQQNSARLEAVRKHILEKDYPEVFGSTNYKTRIEGVLDLDVDNDGENEVVILFHPHYRQSAPILIYKVTTDLKVSRIAEGLAPGPLQPVTGDYLDSHTMGQAVDFELGNTKAAPAKTTLEEVLKTASKNHLNGFVIYDSFYHMDGRAGLPYLIDMRGVSVPSNMHDCSSFEFSRVNQIAGGHLREDTGKNYLAAWVGEEIYVYLITGASNQGLLDKKKWVVKAPRGFSGFLPDQGLTYKTDAGTETLSLK